jgi:hypothetical protein
LVIFDELTVPSEIVAEKLAKKWFYKYYDIRTDDLWKKSYDNIIKASHVFL